MVTTVFGGFCGGGGEFWCFCWVLGFFGVVLCFLCFLCFVFCFFGVCVFFFIVSLWAFVVVVDDDDVDVVGNVNESFILCIFRKSRRIV